MCGMLIMSAASTADVYISYLISSCTEDIRDATAMREYDLPVLLTVLERIRDSYSMIRDEREQRQLERLQLGLSHHTFGKHAALMTDGLDGNAELGRT